MLAGLIALTIAFSGSTTTVPSIAPVPPAQTVQQYIEEYFKDTPVMIEIARCESQFQQFNKTGKPVKNPKSSAIGVFQIMASIHQDLADEKLGLDITTLEGNMAYAKVLYKDSGTVPWNDSKSCWGKSEKIAKK